MPKQDGDWLWYDEVNMLTREGEDAPSPHQYRRNTKTGERELCRIATDSKGKAKLCTPAKTSTKPKAPAST